MIVDFSDEQIDRYARHLVLPEVGEAGQAKLLNARVLVVAAGGLGSPLLLYLAAPGVGYLGVVDDERGRVVVGDAGEQVILVLLRDIFCLHKKPSYRPVSGA